MPQGNDGTPTRPLTPEEAAMREIERRRPLRPFLSPNRGRIFVDNNGSIIGEARGGSLEGYNEIPPQAPQKLTKELEVGLIHATQKIEEENNTRLRASMPPNQGRREEQYLAHARKHKQASMTALEIVHSEVPICIASLGGKRLTEIAHTLRVSNIRLNPENGYINLICTKCGLDTPGSYAYFCNGHVWCAVHVPDLTTCNACSQLVEGCKPVTTYDNRKIMACARCIKIRTHCSYCEKRISTKYIETATCDKCMDRNNSGGPMRGFSKGTKWIDNAKGKVMQSGRVFSCEIEGMTKDGEWPIKLYKSLPKEVGIAVDGSLRNNEGLAGFELQTPKLAGAKGEELIHHMTTSVKTVGAIVNDLCGMHIHLDGSGIIGTNRREYPTALLQLWRTFIVFEDVIMSFLPFSRRRNDYCRPMTEAFKVNDLDIIESLAEAERFWYKERTYREITNAKGSQYHPSRYFGANFHSLLAHGHFEIRFHSGTLMPNKILQWANLHALIMDAATEGRMDVDFFREAQATYRLTDKTELLFERIGLAETSRQYFRGRQAKFAEKKAEDDETKKSLRTSQDAPPRVTVVTRNHTFSPPFIGREQMIQGWNIAMPPSLGQVDPGSVTGTTLGAIEELNIATEALLDTEEDN